MDAPLHTEITARELNQNSGHILDRVRNGETITVTRDGRPEDEIHKALAKDSACDGRDSRGDRVPVAPGGPVTS